MTDKEIKNKAYEAISCVYRQNFKGAINIIDSMTDKVDEGQIGYIMTQTRWVAKNARDVIIATKQLLSAHNDLITVCDRLREQIDKDDEETYE